MKPKIIRARNLKEKDFGSKKIIDLLDTKDYPKLSINIVKHVEDSPRAGVDTESDVAYYVLEGSGKITIEDEEHLLKKGDLAFIPSGTKYKKTKGLTLLAIASPRFDRNKRRYI